MKTKNQKKQKRSRLSQEKVDQIKSHISENGYESMREIANVFDISYWQARKVCLGAAEEGIQFQGDDPLPAEKGELAPRLMLLSVGLSLLDWNRAMNVLIRVLEEPTSSVRSKDMAKKILIELGESLADSLKG